MELPSQCEDGVTVQRARELAAASEVVSNPPGEGLRNPQEITSSLHLEFDKYEYTPPEADGSVWAPLNF